MSKTENIKQFVKEWMEGHEPDTFVKNAQGVVMYSAGGSSLNLTAFFESLIEDFIESEHEPKQPKIEGDYLDDFINVVEERIEHFASKHHSYESKELQGALNTVIRLVPPDNFKREGNE